MNLNLAQIAGVNYMSLAATNQFDGSAGANRLPFCRYQSGRDQWIFDRLQSHGADNSELERHGSGLEHALAGDHQRRGIKRCIGTNDLRVLIVDSQLKPMSLP